MSKEDILHASCRMALAGFLHDIGKFAERAKINVEPQVLEDNKQRYCPHHKKHEHDKGWFSHVHAAYTGMAVDILEEHAPDLVGDNVYPFGSWLTSSVDDSLINAAAAHHNPDTFLQWIIATADRVASGFEREAFEKYNQAEEKNHYQSRQLTLFEQVGKKDENFSYRYALKPLSPASIFPIQAKDCEIKDDKAAQDEYLKLWEQFKTGLQDIPSSHRRQLPLWLDHFDSCWQTYTHSIPSATAFGAKPDVSLYDHSKAVAALTVALWRYHHDRKDDAKQATVNMRERLDWNEEKLLLIQGDFFGIQDFIFAQGGDSTKKAAKLLRGRSFYVSLITECAALAVLEALNLPSTSQIINAAGKFLIVAPNTEETKAVLNSVQKTFNDWFLANSYGQSGLGLAWQAATCDDFVFSKEKQGFKALMAELHKKLERSKYSHFDLCSDINAPAVFDDYLSSFNADFGVCTVNDKAPAAEKNKPSELAQDQINIGTWLVKQKRLLITREPLTGLDSLTIPLFGYSIQFTGSEGDSGKFGREVDNGNIRRVFDFSSVDKEDQALWKGYARRNISGYVPYFQNHSEWENPKYKNCEIDDEININAPKTLNYLACEDLNWDNDSQKWLGIRALAVLKGDIDDLGLMFQSGLEQPTFAKMAALSRQVNNFFAVYLPYLCQTKYPNTYIVFAGGDDFFLLGSWKQLMLLAAELKSEFSRYVANNASIHFSAGLSVTKPKIPIHQLAVMGEDALEQAKAHPGKNAVTCFGQTVSWVDFDRLLTVEHNATEHLEFLREHYALSTGYIYGLLRLTDMAANPDKPENALWRSQLHYRTYRLIAGNRGIKKTEDKKRACLHLVEDIGEKGIKKFGGGYRIALHAYLYQHREQN
ncbi:MAG: type III-A CRISPR-associated protein Cas10/Csm1 [Methyloprofundus sp.]|nr:type III-A CRISPR-associated protein Cas10/Csm1 [Methyloprofundus sp.]